MTTGDRKSTTDRGDDADEILHNSEAVIQREAINGLLQFDEVLRLAASFIPALKFDATSEMVLNLNRIAIQGIRHSAGRFRQESVAITNTAHVPPAHEEVPRFVAEMCHYVNSHWHLYGDDTADALHISSYFMWRLNWIHPFRDGNGRTSRAMAYLALCTRLGILLPGTPTIADQIVDNRLPYYHALDAADTAWRECRVDVSEMETLIRRLLEKQLSSVTEIGA